MTDTREKIIEDLEVELNEFKDAITLLKIEFTNKLALLKLELSRIHEDDWDNNPGDTIWNYRVSIHWNNL